MTGARIPAAPDDVERLQEALEGVLDHYDEHASNEAFAAYEKAEAALSAIPIPAPTGEVERLRSALEEADLRACMIAEAIMNGCSSQKAIDELHDLQRKVVAALADHTTKDDE